MRLRTISLSFDQRSGMLGADYHAGDIDALCRVECFGRRLSSLPDFMKFGSKKPAGMPDFLWRLAEAAKFRRGGDIQSLSIGWDSDEPDGRRRMNAAYDAIVRWLEAQPAAEPRMSWGTTNRKVGSGFTMKPMCPPAPFGEGRRFLHELECEILDRRCRAEEKRYALAT